MASRKDLARVVYVGGCGQIITGVDRNAFNDFRRHRDECLVCGQTKRWCPIDVLPSGQIRRPWGAEFKPENPYDRGSITRVTFMGGTIPPLAEMEKMIYGPHTHDGGGLYRVKPEAETD